MMDYVYVNLKPALLTCRGSLAAHAHYLAWFKSVATVQRWQRVRSVSFTCRRESRRG